MPGLRDFFNELYADGIHHEPKGHYLISLVFLSSLYQQSFEGEVTEAGSDLTPEQAKIFQRIAWETVANDPLSSVGLSRKIKAKTRKAAHAKTDRHNRVHGISVGGAAEATSGEEFRLYRQQHLQSAPAG